MGLFNNIFGANSASDDVWIRLQSEADWKAALERSFEKRIAVFKHSTRCMISKMVLSNFEADLKENAGDTELYFLDLINYRSVSNKIAADLGVQHQSPQLIVIENGKAIHDASHNSIDTALLNA